MLRRPPRSTRTDTLFPYTTLFRTGRARAEGRTGLVMGWQNTRPIADRLDRLHFFHRLGLRIMQPTYNYRNFLGDGCLEEEGAGLSSFGRDAVRLMNELGIAIDLSHVGYRTAMDVIELSAQPVLVTHAHRSEERRVGKECVSTCRSRWCPYP